MVATSVQRPWRMMCVTDRKGKIQGHENYEKYQADSLAETLDSFDVNGAAQDASPNLIFGTSSSPSMSASAFVIVPISN
jgi:hypothetical protein